MAIFVFLFEPFPDPVSSVQPTAPIVDLMAFVPVPSSQTCQLFTTPPKPPDSLRSIFHFRTSRSQTGSPSPPPVYTYLPYYRARIQHSYHKYCWPSPSPTFVALKVLRWRSALPFCEQMVRTAVNRHRLHGTILPSRKEAWAILLCGGLRPSPVVPSDVTAHDRLPGYHGHGRRKLEVMRGDSRPRNTD